MPVRAITLEEACALTAGATMWSSAAVPDAGIPAFTMADGPMGIASGRVDERDISLLTPCPTALGASWDVDLARRVGAVVGSEAVTRGIDAVLAPNINLARSPLAGRAFEYFSEDPLLAGLIGAGWITGLQSTGTGAIAKHLVCNDSETERDRVDVIVDERTLREVYLLPFELAAEAGCAGMLAAYNKVNGAWCSEQAQVLTNIVRQEWGFSGCIMSDWFGTHAGEVAINAGLDLEMPGPARVMGAKLVEAVTQGRVARARIDAAAAHVATTARRVTGSKVLPVMPAEAKATLEEAAAAGMVLLRNEADILPLVPGRHKRIAVIGPNAAAPCYQGGTFAKIAVTPEAATPIEAIAERYGAQCKITFEPGVDPQPCLPAMPMAMRLDYFASTDCSGEPLSSETRDANSLVWFVGVHDQGRFDQPGSIRASGRFTPSQTGMHRYYLGATGVARMRIDGREVLKAGRTLPPTDVMGVLKRGDADVVEVALEAGREVLVTVEFSYTAARVQGLWYGIRGPDSAKAMLERAVAAARAADAVVLIIGETSDSSVESKDRPDTRLPPEQLRLIAEVTAVNPCTIAVVNVGHAFDAEWAEGCAALLVAWYPGQEFGPALASVLAGDREPGGRMPVSIARAEADYCGYALTPASDGRLAYAEGTRLGYRGLIANGTPARHALGSGFGYARFAWEDVAWDGEAALVTLRNVSDRTGAELVQLYRDTPECTLVGFAKLSLAPGEARRVRIVPQPKAMRQWHDGWRKLGDVPLRLARNAEDPGLIVGGKA